MKDINLIYGKNPVIEAIRAKKALKVFAVNNFNDQKILSLIRDNHLTTVTVSPVEMIPEASKTSALLIIAPRL